MGQDDTAIEAFPTKIKRLTMKMNLLHFRINSHSTLWFRCFGLALVGVLLAGCPAAKQTAPPPVSHDGKVVIRGSNTIGEELAPRLIAEFKQVHPDIEFELTPKATMYGLAALRVGQCNIAAASRLILKEEEEVAQNMGLQMKDYTIGAYSVAVVVNAANPVQDLSRDQVRGLFNGTIANWKEVGGPDAPVHLHIRDPISGTYLGFKEMAMKDDVYAHDVKLHTNYTEIVNAVAHDPNGIGYTSLNLTSHNGVKAVSIGGVEPKSETVHKGDYPYARVLRFYTIKGREPAEVGEFLAFVTSPQGQEVVAQAGFTPAPK